MTHLDWKEVSHTAPVFTCICGCRYDIDWLPGVLKNVTVRHPGVADFTYPEPPTGRFSVACPRCHQIERFIIDR